RALQAFALATAPTDAALALRCGAPQTAFALAQQHCRADPGDLLSQIVFALTTDVAPDAIGCELKKLDDELRQQGVEAVALLGERGLAAAVLPRLRALAAAAATAMAPTAPTTPTAPATATTAPAPTGPAPTAPPGTAPVAGPVAAPVASPALRLL